MAFSTENDEYQALNQENFDRFEKTLFRLINEIFDLTVNFNDRAK